ncbi:hypothetical protein [Paraburkholderia sp. RAU2J]|uniref:hypothetical protein n=1 Tax=Paraburkholderia sp. RAU2J TaxID=1938810 RepID=UPI0018F66C70|nr:hypothetical protein [Paraburkholderia sp. RAU2J]
MAHALGGGYLAGSLIVDIGRPFAGPAYFVQPGTVMSRPIRTVIGGGGIAGILLATRRAAIYAHSDKARDPDGQQPNPYLETGAPHDRGRHCDVSQQQLGYLVHASAHQFAWQPDRTCRLDRACKEVLPDEVRTPGGEPMLEARTVTFDVLLLSASSQVNDSGVSGVGQHYHFTGSRKQAEAFNVVLRDRILRAVAKDERLRAAIVGEAPPASSSPLS